MNKLAVAYRIYPKVSKVPPIFANDKLKLSELCLRSFRDSLDGLDVRMWALLDGCPPEYEELFRKYFGDTNLEIEHLPSVGNAGSFGRQMDILLGQDFSEYIYFAEDDYFYLPGQFHEMTDLIDNYDDVDFVSPYDHLDYYELALQRRPCRVDFRGNRHWRTAATTCMTFLTSRQGLRDTEDVFRSYTKKNYDASLWMSATKFNVFNPGFYLRALSDSFYSKIAAKMWMHSPIHNLFVQRRNLWTPLPSIATHMDSEHLSPGFDWQSEFARYK
ncbi:MAG: glycosyltransferase family 2 protein [Bacteroidota bacterium]